MSNTATHRVEVFERDDRAEIWIDGRQAAVGSREQVREALRQFSARLLATGNNTDAVDEIVARLT